ncbi:MAG: deoxyribose-phosphate aldolase [Clostridiaceae bacterium]|nr:deoxyribose-phosphate aldolase [Clostridiaceae bacterium]
MKLTAKSFAGMVDATAIGANLSFSSHRDLVEYSKKYEFAQIFGFASYYPYLLENMKGCVTGVGGGVGSSLGAGTELTEVKVFEAKKYIEMGCDEIDMWMNIAAFRNGEYEYVLEDLKAVRDVVPSNHNLKVIIECAILSPEQIEKACELVILSGADFVKSGTGNLGACTVEHARLMLRGANNKIKVKCAGGIRDLETVKRMVELGVHRIGMNVYSAEAMIRQLPDE